MDTEHVVDVSEDERRPRRLSERLREAREYLGLSQQYVSDKTGIHAQVSPPSRTASAEWKPWNLTHLRPSTGIL
ncbi:MAG: hypothetical protein WKH64_00180 [Chloroflexia bacterium]